MKYELQNKLKLKLMKKRNKTKLEIQKKTAKKFKIHRRYFSTLKYWI